MTYGIDQAGHRTAGVATNQQGNFLEGHFYIYDEHGILSEEIVIPHTGPSIKKIFNAQGKLTDEAEFKDGNKTVESKRIYDATGRLSEIVDDFYFLSSQEKTILQRDKDGKIREIIYEVRGLPTEAKWRRRWVMTYSYDAMGNWIKKSTQAWWWPGDSPEPKRVFWGEFPELVTERAIVYH
jgi:hypothetical protein